MTLHQKILFIIMLFGIAGLAVAGELVYQPVNPSFGGSPLNGPVLLSLAQAQNQTREILPASDATQAKTELQQFNETLQRSVLSRLASAATAGVIGANGQLVPGNLQTDAFNISIVDLQNGQLRITTSDKNTGESTTFEVGK